jgi:hypothetical protein
VPAAAVLLVIAVVVEVHGVRERAHSRRVGRASDEER